MVETNKIARNINDDDIYSFEKFYKKRRVVEYCFMKGCQSLCQTMGVFFQKEKNDPNYKNYRVMIQTIEESLEEKKDINSSEILSIYIEFDSIFEKNSCIDNENNDNIKINKKIKKFLKKKSDCYQDFINQSSFWWNLSIFHISEKYKNLKSSAEQFLNQFKKPKYFDEFYERFEQILAFFRLLEDYKKYKRNLVDESDKSDIEIKNTVPIERNIEKDQGSSDKTIQLLTNNLESAQSENTKLKKIIEDFNHIEKKKANDRNCLFEFKEFKKIKEISRGSFGIVHQVSHNTSKSKYFAIKTITIHSGKLPQDIEKEINLWEKLRNFDTPCSIPNFYGFHKEDLGFSGLSYHLIFDFFPKSLKNIIDNLKALKQSTPFPLEKIIHFSKSLLKALAFLQTLKFCHRDLKPDNLLLDESSNNIFIIDFSESKEIITYASNQTKNELTLVGSPKYFSPELYRSFKQDNNSTAIINPFKSDVFSLGLIMLELGNLEIPIRDKDEEYKKNIRRSIRQFKKNYENMINGDKEKEELESMIILLKVCLEIDVDERPDFIKLFFTNVLNYQSMDLELIRKHIII